MTTKSTPIGHHTGPFKSLENLPFDNTALHTLPIDPIKENYVRRSVKGACFSLVEPTPIENPRLVCYCPSALALIDLDPNETKRPDFAEYLCGNKKIPGSETAAHCYCGFQFGNFAGQLGDGRALYLGEIVNNAGERWELQFKGAGPTPYSRDADGRAVLRSSIREFLCSEALYYLGIPTTRAATVVTSDTTVMRDLQYTGNPIEERATVVLRLASTFLRFGSFQIFIGEDPTTGRAGPSEGRVDIMQTLLDYVIRTHYPAAWALDAPAEEKYAAFYKEIVQRTAKLVADWQCVGFAHGVLNTDNMSIVGLTIDYGPFGFMDYYDPDFICNGSDHEGRYSFKNQPPICKWNCQKLAEAIAPLLPLETSTKILEDEFDATFDRHYHEKMRKKLGFIDEEKPEDRHLVDSLLQVMADTGSDFTNTFRSLLRIRIHEMSPETAKRSEKTEADLEDDALLDYILTQVESANDIIKRKAPKLSRDQLRKLVAVAQKNPYMLYMMGTSPEMLVKELKKFEEFEKIQEGFTEERKAASDASAWHAWIEQYRARVQAIGAGRSSEEIQALNQERTRIIKGNSPKYVLRNYIAQEAIAKAENGDFSEVEALLKRFHDPYALEEDEDVPEAVKVCVYNKKRPGWANELCVTCSS
eukprot:Phypoly_transcript_03863.p1 GENE.Phypoly_transcript_03863~~Phypoly_transcript_03863.p1  ORF type:complete len:736 (+),score=121.16 Phypoly_transcript_03863:278-2209(+)